VIGGWSTNAIVQLQSGLPMTPQHSGDAGSMGTNQALRPDLICNPNLPRGEQTVEKFFRTECLALQTPMRYGTSGRAVFSGPGRIGIDLSVGKVFRFSEHRNLQFRTEFFNAFNHPNFNPPNKLWGTQTLDA